MTQVNILGTLEEQGVVRAVLNPDGSYSLVLANGTILQSVSPVFAWPGITIAGVPTLPAANTFENGAVVMLHKDNFVGAGANACGVEIKADALNNIWRPRGRQILWSGFLGLRASPGLSRTTVGRFALSADPVLPAGLLNYENARLRCSALLYSTNAAATTGPTPAIYIGTDLATYTNNKTILNNPATATDNVTIQPDTLFVRASATSGLTTRSMTRGTAGTGGSLLQDVSGGLLNFASAQMITYAISNMGSATQVDQHAYEIAWES